MGPDFVGSFQVGTYLSEWNNLKRLITSLFKLEKKEEISPISYSKYLRAMHSGYSFHLDCHSSG